MKKETIIAISAGVFFIMIIIALFTSNPVQDAAQDVLHEIKTADAWKQAGYVPGANCMVPQQVALQAGAPAIEAGQTAPILIKYMGVEVIEVGGGKVKITGIMGNSRASTAKLQNGDILLSFNTKPITSLGQFQKLLAALPPEKDYKFTYLRGARKKQGSIFIGEGEMEGFLPIPQPK